MPLVAGAGNILLVDDYADAQRWAYYGLNGNMSDQPMPYAGFQEMNYFFQRTTNRNPDNFLIYPDVNLNANDDSPFVQNSQIWRVLCRGPVPQSLLQAYLPQPYSEFDQNGNKLMVNTGVKSWSGSRLTRTPS